tara:strand:+ start:1332 stop:4262 length:2931 start_codon:yes stop_codon:yes gene_type:complete
LIDERAHLERLLKAVACSGEGYALASEALLSFLTERKQKEEHAFAEYLKFIERWIVDARLTGIITSTAQTHAHPGFDALLNCLWVVDPKGDAERKSRHRNFDNFEELRLREEENFRKAENKRIAREAKEREMASLKAKREENERIAREAREREIASFKSELAEKFSKDFLETDKFYKSCVSPPIDFDEYRDLKAKFVGQWFANRRRNIPDAKMPDLDQCQAIAATVNDVQLIARAGSGKTATLVDRAEFLIAHCKVEPETILLLAFNKKAALEIRERLQNALQIHREGSGAPHFETFHALAYALVHPETILVDGADEESGQQSLAVQAVIDDHLRVEPYRSKIRDVMLAYFREDWDAIVEGHFDTDQQTFLKLRRSLQRQSLKGEPLKSRGEKLIADFLFEHNIPYRYEQNHFWNDRNYKPDFTVPLPQGEGLVIEYFGLEGDPDYDEISDQKRDYWRTKEAEGWKFLELTPINLRARGPAEFKNLLRERLASHGVECTKLSEDEIWESAKRRAIDTFTSVVKNFIGRCRQAGLSPDQLNDKIAKWFAPSRSIDAFLNVALAIYGAYLLRLEATGEDDFNGLMHKAAQKVRNGDTRFKNSRGEGDLRKLKFVFIDEYQDFSKSFFELIQSARSVADDAKLFCVGDDWQAINAFAGSDLTYFEEFERYFGSAEKLTLLTNYRSCSKIVDAGNDVMEGRGPSSQSSIGSPGEVWLAYMGDFSPTLHERELFGRKHFIAAVLRIVRATVAKGDGVILLSRTKRFEGFDADEFLSKIRGELPDELSDMVSLSTVHSFKGKQAAVAIILDATAWAYPLIHPQWVFTEILGSSVEGIVEDELRLFYVAVTRAKKELYIITDGARRSPFLDRLKHTVKLDWASIATTSLTARRATVRIANQPHRGAEPTILIKDSLRANGYNWHSVEKVWWKTVAAQGFTAERIQSEPWVSVADGVTLKIEISAEGDNQKIQYDINNGICGRV